jgi:HEPN domain-containing protein
MNTRAPTSSGGARLSKTLRSYWTDQSGRDLSLAQIALDSGYPEWACYLAQQAAEKAVKSVFFELETHWPHQFTVHNVNDLILYIPMSSVRPPNASSPRKYITPRDIRGYYRPDTRRQISSTVIKRTNSYAPPALLSITFRSS